MDVTGGRWEVVGMDNQLVRFELTGSTGYVFNPGDSKTGLLLRASGLVLDPDDNMAIDLTDPMEVYSGYFTPNLIGISNGSRGLAKFRSDTNQWEITSHALGKRYGKASADWVQDAGGDYVNVNLCKRDGTVIVTEAIKVWLPTPEGQDPAVFLNDVISFEADEVEKDYVANGYGSDELATIKQWHNSAALATGWVESDAAVLPGDKKVADTNAPDGEGRVLMGREVGGSFDEDSIGNVLGFRAHGETENNHTDHDNHRHFIDAGGATVLVDVGTTTEVPTVAGVTSGVAPIVADVDILNHLGDENFGAGADKDTDNRQRTLVTRFKFRYK
jgi:hypothetical protein